MTVRRYRDVSELPAVPPRRPDDPDNLRLACEWSRLACTLAGTRLESGVHRFRSHEALQRHTGGERRPG